MKKSILLLRLTFYVSLGIMTFYSNYNTFQFHGSSNNLESDKVMPFSQKKKKNKVLPFSQKKIKKKKKIMPKTLKQIIFLNNYIKTIISKSNPK